MEKMRINVMRKGDRCIGVTPTHIAIQRRNGEVDLFPVTIDENSMVRINLDNVLTIGFGEGEAEFLDQNGIRIKTF